MRILALWVCLGLAAQTASAVRVIDEEAIPYAGFLSKSDFDARYPGEKISDVSKIEPGWYVIYEHESLSYFFGPILLESTGQDYLNQLRGIVTEAVAKRPTIRDYRLELSYEPRASDTGSSSSDAGSGADSSGSGVSQPESRPSIWTIFRRLFGF